MLKMLNLAPFGSDTIDFLPLAKRTRFTVAQPGVGVIQLGFGEEHRGIMAGISWKRTSAFAANPDIQFKMLYDRVGSTPVF